ncbi:hypothetical protein RBSWK_03697 [Rhodopirellula baltica SWK14]|uniref:Uncharacterized protein n=1 Tax=Rhodopirellula baltica SWK14 TaxID=993516 RepID=L7CEE8_RHOBT|nr:hypothetical protein RBSWK_03697 [Rhodopirellula baltica SWK14]
MPEDYGRPASPPDSTLVSSPQRFVGPSLGPRWMMQSHNPPRQQRRPRDSTRNGSLILLVGWPLLADI